MRSPRDVAQSRQERVGGALNNRDWRINGFASRPVETTFVKIDSQAIRDKGGSVVNLDDLGNETRHWPVCLLWRVHAHSVPFVVI